VNTELWPWLALLTSVAAAALVWSFGRHKGARGGAGGGLLARAIRRGFGGYVHDLNQVDGGLPEALPADLRASRRVLVVGGGLAGIGAAADLAERGFQVTLWEQSPYLGGKIGAWRERDAGGTELSVDHGFHAFFRHYYNLQSFLERTGLKRHLTPVEDYLIVGADGSEHRFGDVETTPLLNLLALTRRGLFRLRDLVLTPALNEMEVFLAYDGENTFRELDKESYAAFAKRAQLPEKLQLVFSTFARSFFADGERMSMAELVKSFHFYYLSHDHGLIYDYPAGSYEDAVLAPLRAYMKERGVVLELGRSCGTLTPRECGGYTVDGQSFEYVVLATSAIGAQGILKASPDLGRRAPTLARQLAAVRPGQRYAVLRLWTTRALRAGLPVFASTERMRVLDSVTQCHRVAEHAAEFVRAHPGGSVLELHSYAVPDDLPDSEVKRAFLDDLLHYFPELRGQEIVHEVLTVRSDFTAFHVGMADARPTTACELDGLYLAGDWVKLPSPAMLMEAAYTSGLLATNLILSREGLRPYAVRSVPLTGLLAPLRRRKLAQRARGQHAQPETSAALPAERTTTR
jgi:carotenoid phi-ring synthase / carotenoid chi-ring synthase